MVTKYFIFVLEKFQLRPRRPAQVQRVLPDVPSFRQKALGGLEKVRQIFLKEISTTYTGHVMTEIPSPAAKSC